MSSEIEVWFFLPHVRKICIYIRSDNREAINRRYADKGKNIIPAYQQKSVISGIYIGKNRQKIKVISSH